MNKIALSAVALALAAAPATAQVLAPQFDNVGDAPMTQDQYAAGFSGAGTFANYDADGDMMLSEQEFTDGFADIGEYRDEGFEMGAFADYDSDADGFLSEDEYNAAWFQQYDADGSGDIDASERAQIDADFGEDGLFMSGMDTDA